jgi:replicative DNA helicase
MSIWQAGFHRVVAVMGGNLNDNHVKEIGENEVVFVPDRKKETDFELFRKSVFRVRRAHPGLVIKAALLPEGDANSVDPEVLKQAIEAAEVAELAILKHDLRDSANRDAEYALARRIVTQIADVLTKDDIERWLAERWGKPLDLIKQAMARPGDTVGTNVMTVSQALDSLEIRERTAAIDGLGFRCFGLHNCIKRPHGGQVAVIAGRTSVGKTMLALNLLHHSRENDIPTLFVSMEQPASELVYRLSLMSSEDIEPLNSDQLSKHVLDDDDHWRALRGLVELGYPTLRICDKILTAQEVADHVVDASYSIGEKVRLLIVDYIGLIKHGRGNLDSYERVSAIMREMQDVTKSLDVFGTYLCQLSRAAGDGSTRVTLDMMRDSGVVEEVADYIVGVWRDKDRNDYDGMNLTKIYSRVCKNRHGPLGDSELWLRTDTLTIRPVDQTHREVKDTSQGREKVFDN